MKCSNCHDTGICIPCSGTGRQTRGGVILDDVCPHCIDGECYHPIVTNHPVVYIDYAELELRVYNELAKASESNDR